VVQHFGGQVRNIREERTRADAGVSERYITAVHYSEQAADGITAAARGTAPDCYLLDHP